MPLADTAILHREARLAALRRCGLLDTPPEASLDVLTALAARLLTAPVALVSLVAADRQFFKSAYGLPEPWASWRQTPLSHSFCQHVVARGQALLIGDARQHPLVHDNLAIVDLQVIAYLGVPLQAEGQPIGAFCVIDHQPRRWSADDYRLLEQVGLLVTLEIERQRLARTLHRQRETFRRLLERISDGWLVVDRQGQVRQSTPGAEQRLGLSERPRSGHTLWQLLPAPAAAWLRRRCRRVLASGEVTILDLPFTRRPLTLCALPEQDELTLFLWEKDDRQAVPAELERAALLPAGRQLAHQLNNDIALPFGILELVTAIPDLPAQARDWLEEALRGLERLHEHVSQFHRSVRSDMMVPPALPDGPSTLTGAEPPSFSSG
ncbi:MAG: GAF domain-containing protein [Chloroflexi bacterium]|nr:GAF domain-containing protein [Chloroflexota bacterium]